MAGRAWLETWKFLDAKEVLTVIATVCSTWKKSVYSDEIFFYMLGDADESEENKSLPLYRRLKKALKTVKYLLHTANSKLHIWNISRPSAASVVLKRRVFLNSSRYVLITRSTAMIAGGEGNQTSCLQVDMKTGDIISLPTLLKPHAWHSMAVLRHVVFISGGDLFGVYHRYAEKYEQGTWTEIADMAIPRYNHTLCAYRHLVYAFGGSNDEGYQDSIEYYNGTMWSVAHMSLPYPQNYPSVLPSKQGLLLVGGCRKGSRGRSIDIWKEASQQWHKIRAIKTDYSLSNATAIRHGVVYIFNHRPSRDSWPVALKEINSTFRQ